MTDSNALAVLSSAQDLIASSGQADQLNELNKKLAGGGGGANRLSLKGSKFRIIMGGEQVQVSREATLEVIIVGTSNVVRTYYAGSYDSDNPSAPACWSDDSNSGVPSPNVSEPMAPKCGECQFNVKGSGQGESRACRYSQRIAVMIVGDKDENVFQLSVPAASLFGDAVGNDMGLQAYARLLQAHKTPVIAVTTELRFDDESEVPKLFFSPKRALTPDELKLAMEKNKDPATATLLEMTVAQADGVQALPDAEEKNDANNGTEHAALDKAAEEAKKAAEAKKAEKVAAAQAAAAAAKKAAEEAAALAAAAEADDDPVIEEPTLRDTGAKRTSAEDTTPSATVQTGD